MRDVHMIEPEELEGIVDALGAATHEEVISIVKELAYERDEDEPLNEEIEKMCEKAVSENLLETISSEELSVECETCEECMEFYILGPNAFPEYPFELSEVIDILKLDRREVDSEKLKQIYSERLKTRLTELRYNIDKYSKNVEGILDIPTLERQYSELLNVYYDYDSWLEGGIADMENDILALSKQIDSLGKAQDI
ncbi:DUF7109 family protein [Methanococcoides burtonii]|uniref:Uncharacterized protein n=1 Tax=Methanococcoides burtonii (strain DSM 6242 / NBRC 107633 / OCM 468 / ACE-M) TaxID=259564 RepID=Q12WR4_METBU|nr:hypothetical protein [Methanococcoides burtonii]ABE52112.1 Hypothetical protein Mbur_1189 [Methanococcoides burtonii DSM 6242]